MSDFGWIKLHRHLTDDNLWKSEPFTRGQAWVDLLLLTNHADGFYMNRGIKIPVLAGQCGWTIESLAKKWKWSRGKAERYFLMLESMNQIVRQKNNVSTVITITNWNKYQTNDKPDDNTSGKASSKADGHQTDINKNVKKKKNEKEKLSVAEFLRNKYDQLSENTSPKQQTIENIKKCLNAYPSEILFYAMIEYLNSVLESGPKYRKICSNFFGTQKVYLDYLPANIDDPETKERLEAMKNAIAKGLEE